MTARRGPVLASRRPRGPGGAGVRPLSGGPACAALFVAIAAGVLALWTVLPVAWLWIAGRVDGAWSLEAAVGVGFTGFVASVVIAVRCLLALDHLHGRMREARGRPIGETSAFEACSTVVGGVVAIAFSAWFLFLSGASPIPIEVRAP